MNSPETDGVWNSLTDQAAEALRMSADEKTRFAANQVARLVGLLPFLAGCEEPERTALSHLAIWVVANRGEARKVFDHKPADDREPLARLAPIADFRGGNPAVIKAGMDRLALCMVAGYRRDLVPDREKERYNPLGAGRWNVAELFLELGAPTGAEKSQGAAPGVAADPGVDAVLDSEVALRIWWDPK